MTTCNGVSPCSLAQLLGMAGQAWVGMAAPAAAVGVHAAEVRRLDLAIAEAQLVQAQVEAPNAQRHARGEVGQQESQAEAQLLQQRAFS